LGGRVSIKPDYFIILGHRPDYLKIFNV
jgi:hypothetical protein